ncbi:hypothetical protein, partial [Evtepia gabavorous]|uniref:hypothetical protein n=1 Tax=Evtepia gabavorous TaxID=2211183 RepID=UPI003A8DA24A
TKNDTNPQKSPARPWIPKKPEKNEPQEKICRENRFTNCRENDMMKNDILLQFLPALSGRGHPGKGFSQ